METLRFSATISKEGTIKLPAFSHLSGKTVEIIVLLKENKRGKRKEFKASDFVDKWAGVLKSKDIEDNKLSYLLDKYK